MAKTLDKQFRYESGILGLAELCDPASLVVLYDNTNDMILSESGETKTFELRVNLDESELAKSPRAIYYTIVHTGMSLIRGTEEEDTTIVEDWPVADEFDGIATESCIAFCNSRGLVSTLRSCVCALERLFSNRHRLIAEVDHFPDDETENSEHVVLRLEVVSGQGTVLEEYDKWIDWFVENVDDVERSLFVLTVSRV